MNNISLYLGGGRWDVYCPYEFPMPEHIKEFLYLGNKSNTDFCVKVIVRSDIEINYNELKKIYCNEDWLVSYRDQENNYVLSFLSDEISCISAIKILANFSEVEIYICEEKISEHNISLFETTPFLMGSMMILLNNNGVVLHSSAMILNNQGILFCGESGAGKTTISEIFSKSPSTVLTDESVILRKINEKLYMYGSPWKGSGANFYKNACHEVNYLYFIYHGKSNKLVDINKNAQLKILLKQVFPFFWDRKYMLKSFAFISRIPEYTICKRLYFKPNNSIVDFIYNKLERNNVTDN